MSIEIQTMSNKEFGERVKTARNRRGLSQAELAKIIGVSRVMVANYEHGKSEPKQDTLMRIVSALGTSSGWLLNGTGGEFYIESTAIRENLPATINMIPIISWEDVEKWPLVDTQGKTYKAICPPEPVSNKAFALEIIFPAMEPDFRYGDIVVVDPSLQAKSGDYIVFMRDSHCSFRQVFMDSGRVYLKTPNPDFPAEFGNDFCIVGVVTHAIKKVLHR